MVNIFFNTPIILQVLVPSLVAKSTLAEQATKFLERRSLSLASAPTQCIFQARNEVIFHVACAPLLASASVNLVDSRVPETAHP